MATYGNIAKLRAMARKKFAAPTDLSGDGIIMAGGGRFWPMLYVSLKMLREVSDIPVQIWHRGTAEPLPIIGIPGVTVYDATALQPKPRLSRWEIKTVALKNCGWRRAVYLDADAYFVADPRPMFDLLDQHRFAFWTDIPAAHHNIDWQWYGLKPSTTEAIQSGQFAIDIPAFWRELEIAYWIDQHSDYFYKHQHGDQDSWRVALTITDGSRLNLGPAIWSGPAFIYDLGQTLIVHRCQSKMWPGSKRDEAAAHLPWEEKTWRYFQEAESLAIAGAHR